VVEWRLATLDDAPAAAELLRARELADFGATSTTAVEIRGWWQEEPDAERWLAFAGGHCVAFGRMEEAGEVAEVHDASCTHPDFEGRGVATALLDRLEETGRRQGFARVRATAANDRGRALLAARGYELVRHFWRMEIALAEAEPAQAPDGYRLAPYREGEDDAALHACHEAAFAEHWGYVPKTLEKFVGSRRVRADYDPRGWVVVWMGNRIAGGSLAFPWEGRGWILDVFVAAEHRGRGLGLALLQETFVRLYELGIREAGLEVDAANETGATRLYERAGMHVTRRYVVYEKPL
jgi:mycothiol synthase